WPRHHTTTSGYVAIHALAPPPPARRRLATARSTDQPAPSRRWPARCNAAWRRGPAAAPWRRTPHAPHARPAPAGQSAPAGWRRAIFLKVRPRLNQPRYAWQPPPPFFPPGGHAGCPRSAAPQTGVHRTDPGCAGTPAAPAAGGAPAQTWQAPAAAA